MSKTVSIQDALQRVADDPNPPDDYTTAPVHQLVSLALFEIANHPDASQRGSLMRANKARKMILDRLVGKRRAGSHPATRTKQTLTFVDLTSGAIE
jgi:hypothetical protein